MGEIHSDPPSPAKISRETSQEAARKKEHFSKGGGDPPFAFRILPLPFFLFASTSPGDFCFGGMPSSLHIQLPMATCSVPTWCPLAGHTNVVVSTWPCSPSCQVSHPESSAPSGLHLILCVDLATPTQSHPLGCSESSKTPL